MTRRFVDRLRRGMIVLKEDTPFHHQRIIFRDRPCRHASSESSGYYALYNIT